jgi:hypothetical protein
MLAESPSPPVAYLWEPFSPLHRPGICAARFPLWFTYVCRENEQPYIDPVADMLDFRYETAAEARAVRSPKDALRMARDWRQTLRYRRQDAVPLMKDPIAFFSAEWLCDTFDMNVIVLIRHPAAFAYSLKRRNLTHPFDDFLRQPLLMRDVLGPFHAQLQEFSITSQPIIDQAILLWRIVHSVAGAYRDRREDWAFLRLEDIARDPVNIFGDLSARLSLAFDESVRKTILAHSASSNPIDVASPSSVRRNSEASITTWKTGLTNQEIDRVRAGVDDVAKDFYSDEDW